jgi:hypothetical protein
MVLEGLMAKAVAKHFLLLRRSQIQGIGIPSLLLTSAGSKI